MDYKVILNYLEDVSSKVKTWERQGYAPSIEKDSVLETLRMVYCQLGPNTTTETESEEQTAAVEVYRKDNGIESLMEFIKNSQTKFMAETSAQISEIKDVLSKGMVSSAEMIKPIESSQPVEEEKSETEGKPAQQSKPTVETKPVTTIKVDVSSEIPVIGFYSLPESMRMNIIHNLFNGDTAKAEISVNKMCSLKSIDDLLIYIEEHFQWSPDNETAASLISTLSKNFS